MPASAERKNGLVALEPAPPSGFSGAAVVDAQGQFVGLAGLKAASQASLVSAAAIRKFLEDAKVTPSNGSTSIDAAKASVTRVMRDSASHGGEPDAHLVR